MPTTCGFPNCKFRSRYRGSDDNRHFYRVPKKPAVLRERWLEAIGRTEQTIVSQLRVCSGHFHDGEKKEGDVPVADPSVDSPIKVELPPRSNKASAERRAKRAKLAIEKQRGSAESPQSSNSSSACVRELLNSSPNSSRAAVANLVSSSTANSTAASVSGAAMAAAPTSPTSTPVLTPTPTPAPAPISTPMASVGCAVAPVHHQRPLVALLDGRDCSVEMPLLKDHATVAFCDAQTVAEVHEKVLNEAVAALMWSSIHLGREELAQFRQLKLLVQIGPGSENIDLAAARSLGIAVSCISGACVEETADSTICLILNLYRKTLFLANNYAKDSNGAVSIDRMAELASGATRIRGQTLGLVGFASKPPHRRCLGLSAPKLGLGEANFRPLLLTFSAGLSNPSRGSAALQLQAGRRFSCARKGGALEG
uniref:THAP-type domain-containing protein n=1 Tax=Macrostomum lignano TaxID=282301 RepID=A0A1I8IUV3_9PLAT